MHELVKDRRERRRHQQEKKAERKAGARDVIVD